MSRLQQRREVRHAGTLGSSGPPDYTEGMTQALQQAIAEISKLPLDEQDRLAHWLLEELASERAWEQKFRASQNVLSTLAAEAREDRAQGRTTEIDPDTL